MPALTEDQTWGKAIFTNHSYAAPVNILVSRLLCQKI